MCRLYGFKATEPSKVECALVDAQNALMAQSRQDMTGMSHGHGWGVAVYRGGLPRVEKQAWAAHHGEQFQKVAARSYSRVVIAHVRHATVGQASLTNTHPFAHGRFVFAHNGTVHAFDRVRERMLGEIDALHRTEIAGSTDSEHIFRLLLSLWERDPARPLVQTLRMGLERMVSWCHEIAPDEEVSLNVLWSDGEQLVGSRLGRTLWYLERDGVHLCQVCGKVHVNHPGSPDDGGYRSVEVASEPITDERWIEVPDRTVYAVDPDLRLHIMPLEPDFAASA